MLCKKIKHSILCTIKFYAQSTQRSNPYSFAIRLDKKNRKQRKILFAETQKQQEIKEKKEKQHNLEKWGVR